MARLSHPELTALVVAAAAALIDWWAVWTDRPRVESVAKPLVMVAAIVAAGVGIDDATARWFVMIGLGLGLVGDVLLLPAVDRFVAGLAAFFVGHLAYVLAFIVSGTQLKWLATGLIVAGVAAPFVGRPIVRGASTTLRTPILAYIVVIAAMVSTALGTGVVLIALGGLLFAGSDGILGWDRFVTPRTDRRVVVHALYHCGQILVVAGSMA